MRQFLKKDRWSPYLVGTLIGMLSWATFYFSSEHFGTTTALLKGTALLEYLATFGHVEGVKYFAKYMAGKPFFSWQTTFVMALFFGSFTASWLSGAKKREFVPDHWRERFGPKRWKRALGAFVGGFFLLFGARLASGCTSGHAISGGLQLALSGWIFIAGTFTSGIATAFLLYRRRRSC